MNRTATDIVDKLLEGEAAEAAAAITAAHAEEPDDFRGPRIAPARQGSSMKPDFYPDVEDIRQLNWEALQRRSADSIVQLVYASFPTNTKFIRVHESEDMPYEPAYYEAWGFIARDNVDVGITVYTDRPEAWESHLGSLPQTMTVIDRRPQNAEKVEAPKPVEAEEAVVAESAETPDEETLLVYADEDDENTFDVFL